MIKDPKKAFRNYEKMNSNRLELALDRLKPSDWERFEKLASAFLIDEFTHIRTVAFPGGDDGRDAELFSPTQEPSIVFQYSVTPKWNTKIKATVKRLKSTLPNTLMLIYVSNQVIGAAADDLKKTYRQEGLTLDVRDKNWFIERVNSTMQRQAAAEELSSVIVDPLLAKSGVGPKVQAQLSNNELTAAVTYLGLQWHDSERDKGLTKLTFESLVLAALSSTDSDNRLSREKIRMQVRLLLPEHPEQQIITYVDNALTRLSKATIKHWAKQDEFCLSHDEVLRVKDYRVDAAMSEERVSNVIARLAEKIVPQKSITAAQLGELASVIRLATDAVLFERSQSFAMAIQMGKLDSLAEEDFRSTVTSEISSSHLKKTKGIDWVDTVQIAVREILISSDLEIQSYLRLLADSYTLMAFLKQTPDVQGAVAKMFSHGTLWLDTNIILPLIAETLADGESLQGRFTQMIDAARAAGLTLNVTRGVIEEVERHMNRALYCTRLKHDQWQGSIPYLLDQYISNGRSAASFENWLFNFRGEARPLDDLADYLNDEFGITERDLDVECAAAEPALRHALEQILIERYDRRQEQYGYRLDDIAITRLVKHDIECYAGIVQLRQKESKSAFGYSAWWLTVDRQAYGLKNFLSQRQDVTPHDSPVMAADFLINYLAFGPNRRNVPKAKGSHLPLLMTFRSGSLLTRDLMDEAERIRSSFAGLPERVIQRNVRDHLDKARAQIGSIANFGMDDIVD
ncbi:hypothetical protein [Massilia yuzhufengensis]|uniref:Uncharacterized protein n=1 Tax=Massilia yuzhufengensis TaxID=1164594 RepID=A0A1I1IU88_9BURK|nr:hypothetical protein [Massilia yuzhufengensis]SFC39847.1 hypothetical protein SAMN05216204_1062 [Massilia yuzhufengensis]